jgi:hypothetical protein
MIMTVRNVVKHIGIRFAGMMWFKTVAHGTVKSVVLAGTGGSGIVKSATSVRMAYLFRVKDAGVAIFERFDMISFFQIALAFFIFLAAGCAPLPHTITGNPEIVLTNIKFNCVRTAFMNSFLNQGYSLRNVSESQIVAGKKSVNAPIWYYTFYLGAPEERITLNFIQLDMPDSLLVVCTAAYVSDAGTASEKSYTVQGTENDLYDLVSMQSIIENRCRKKLDFGITSE